MHWTCNQELLDLKGDSRKRKLSENNEEGGEEEKEEVEGMLKTVNC